MNTKISIVLLTLSLIAVFGEPATRIVDGSLTTINAYPYMSGVLVTFDSVNFIQSCGGTILTSTAVLSAAHCFDDNRPANSWSVRVGSSFAHSGGTVYPVRLINNHPNYNQITIDNDISVVRTLVSITYILNTVAPASIAGSAYNLADNQPLWAIGWGNIAPGGPSSEQLRHIQIWSVNQALCRSRYNEFGMILTDNMLCAGILGVAGHTQCSRDSGGPLIHYNVVVGVCSFGTCGNPRVPTVNARVSQYTSWIQAVAA